MVLRWHGHRREHGGRGRRAVRSASRSRVVLTASPRQPNPRVTDGVALHLVDSHLGGVPLDKLNEATALSGRNLDVGDFSEALEERTELIFGNVTGQPSDEDGGVVGIGELVHRLRSTIVTHWRSTHGVHAHRSSSTSRDSGGCTGTTLRCGGGNAHGTVAAVDSLHLRQGAVLVLLIREANESVSTRHSADGVGHDLGGLARREPRLEERNEDVFVNLGAKVTNEDGVLGTTIITRFPMVLVGFHCQQESSGRITDRLSVSPPPEAQFSLKGRELFGI